MRTYRLLQLLLVVAMSCAVAACDSLAGNESRDALWQAEVEAVSLAMHADAAVEGNMEAFDSLRASRDAVEAALGATATSPLAAGIQSEWSEIRKLADAILSHQQSVLVVTDAEAEFTAAVPQLMARLDEVGRSVSEGSDPHVVQQVYLLGRSQLLLQRMQSRIAQLRAAGAAAISAADAYKRDSTVLERTLAGLQEGDPELAIEALGTPTARTALGEVRELSAGLGTKAEPLLASVTGLLEAREAADELSIAVADLRSSLQRARTPR